MTDLLSRPVVPVADAEDARDTGRALRSRLPDDARIVAVYVVEKAGGAPDKASVEQREEIAAEAFEALADTLGREVETDVRYDTDVVDGILAAAADADATAVAFVARGGSRLVRLLSGDVALSLVTEADRPVVALPAPDDEPGGDDATVGTGTVDDGGGGG